MVAPRVPTLLLFDVFGTVVDWRTSLARQLPEHLSPFGLVVDPAAFADAWRARYQPAMAKIRDGERAWVSLDVLHRENLDEVLRDFGCEALPTAARDGLNRAWYRLDPWPDAASGLLELRDVGFCCALSNGNLRLMAAVARHGDLAWDAILGGEWSRAYKPDAKVYTDAIEAFGIRPEQALMVAAHNGDLEAAAALGLGTAFVRRPLEHGPSQTIDLEASGPWTFVADGFRDLARQLQAI